MLRLLNAELYRSTRRVIVLALLVGYLFFAITCTFNFFTWGPGHGIYATTRQEYVTTVYASYPERIEQELNALWKDIFERTFYNLPVNLLITPAILSLTIGADLRRQRVGEMTAAGNSRFSVYCAKSLCFGILCVAVPLACELLNFFGNQRTYSGYIRTSDVGFMFETIGIMALYTFFGSMVWLPMSFRFDRVGTLASLPLWFAQLVVIAAVKGAAPDRPEMIVIGTVVVAVVSFAAGWLIFSRKRLR